MADTKTSALSAAAVALTTHEFPVNEGGTSKKVTGAQLKTLITTAPSFAAGSASAGSKPVLNSGTLLTSPEAGALEFDATSLYSALDTTNGRGQFVLEQFFKITGNLGTRGGTIADYFDASSAIPTVLNGVYLIEWDLYFLKTTAATLTFTITNTQTYTNLVASWRGTAIAGLAATGAVSEAGIVTNTTAAAALPVTGTLASAVNHHYIVRALAECGTAGNIRLRVTCGSGTITPLRGSMFTVRRLPAGNIGTFAA